MSEFNKNRYGATAQSGKAYGLNNPTDETTKKAEVRSCPSRLRTCENCKEYKMGDLSHQTCLNTFTIRLPIKFIPLRKDVKIISQIEELIGQNCSNWEATMQRKRGEIWRP